ncbi:terpene synthase family protein [Poronia punctata]|nr:terpene synthase family protein [Poronia punctata]
MLDIKYLAKEAKSLMRTALENYTEEYGLGAMSVAAYDTAWVSMVTKVIDGEKQWLFPESFQYLLSTQSDKTGSWENGSDSAQIDGILNTAGPLLALKRHLAEPLQLAHAHPHDLAERVERATVSLRRQLAVWDVSTTEHVGFEIIVPAILELLEKEDPSLVFEFGSKKLLMKIHDKKMARFRPEFLYGPRRFTALHSLESFIGKLDFDKVRHHKVNGSMLGSPSSTAAYLMHSSEWDEESEDYLRHVIRNAAGRGSGAVPSAFPSTHFEITWILSTLLRAGFTKDDLESPELTKMVDILSRSFETEKGVLGFAPFFEADVDDTAKTISTLNMLGRPVSPKSLVKLFEADTHFRTYAGERDPSATANCNALLALLQQPDVSAYSGQILKVTKFLVDFWWTSDGEIMDKWNTCYLYPSVLLVEALTDILHLIEQDKLPGVFDSELQSRLAVALFQACLRPLLDQSPDGSWNQSIEETAYGILILSEARRVCFFNDLRQPLDNAIKRGVTYIQSIHDRPPSYIWIEKVSYASPLLTDSYLLAALKAASSSSSSSTESTIGSSLWNKKNISTNRLDKYVKLFSQAELFAGHPEWELRGSMIEATLLKPLLVKRRLEVFQRKGMQEDKYFDLIPFFWTGPNNRARTFTSASFLYQVSLLSMLTYQVDEFMEAVAAPAYKDRLDELRKVVYEILPEEEDEERPDTGTGTSTNKQTGSAKPRPSGFLYGFLSNFISTSPDTNTNTNTTLTEDPEIITAPAETEVRQTLTNFKKYCLEHVLVQKASKADRNTLRRELRTYLLAQVQQESDSAALRSGNSNSSPKNKSFFHWARSTGADNVSGTFAWSFIACLLSATLTEGGEVFPTAAEKYVAADVARHLSTMARIYNDLGSIRRDEEEGALNSVDFEEFKVHEDVEGKKRALHDIGEYEHACLLLAFKRLEGLGRGDDVAAKRLRTRRLGIWRMFLDQVVLFDQIYVIKDLSSHHVVQGKSG